MSHVCDLSSSKAKANAEKILAFAEANMCANEFRAAIQILIFNMLPPGVLEIAERAIKFATGNTDDSETKH